MEAGRAMGLGERRNRDENLSKDMVDTVRDDK